MLLIFEDAHWIDPTSLEALGRVVDRIQTFRVLLIVTFRPEFNPPWIGQPHVTAVTINRLTQRQVGAMIDGVVGNKLLPASVRQDIIERTDGIPLFVEEMTKAVLEAENEGKVRRTVAAFPSPTLAVPASLHASLMARLDRLGTAKEVVQIGAAIGREFSHALLVAVAHKPEAELAPALKRVVEAGLLFRHGEPPHASYLFKHALVQDAAYGTLLRGKRQELHGRIASVLKQKFPDVVENQPELLAHHLSAAGETSRALEQWLTAGRYAAQRSAHVEALAHFNRALALLASLPETDDRDRQEIEVQIARGLSLFTGRGFQSREAAEAYVRATELCEASGDNRHLFTAVWGSWLSRSATGPMAAARNLSDKLLVLTEKQEDIGLRLQAHHSGWTTYFLCGAPSRSLEHCQLGIRLYDPEKHRPHALLYGGHDPGVCVRTFLATVEWLLGFPDAALASINSAVVLAEQLAHPLSLEMALLYAAIVHNFRREPKDAMRSATEAQALAAEHRLAAFVDPRVLQAAALSEQGQALEAFALLQKANVDDKGSIAPISHQSYALGFLSVILNEVGEGAEALHTVDHALSLAEKSEAQWWEAEVHRIKGSLLLSRRESASSEACFRRSIEIAQQQEARSIELRAATSLARLWCDHGKRIEARDLLSPVYNWFTEGLDTPDLREAKVLLGQMSA